MVSGLWHGASWTFVVWGGLHGLYLACHKKMLGKRKINWERQPANSSEWFAAIPCIVATNLLVLLAWLFFRANSFDDAASYLSIMGSAFVTAKGLWTMGLSLAFFHLVVLAIDLGSYRTDNHDVMESRPILVRAAVYSLFASLIWVAWPTDYAPFIYFQF